MGSREWLLLECWPVVIFCDIFLYNSELSDFGFLPFGLFWLYPSCWFSPNTTLIIHFPFENLPVVSRINLRPLRWCLEPSNHKVYLLLFLIKPVHKLLFRWMSLCIPPTPSTNLPCSFSCLNFVQDFIHVWILFSMYPNASEHPRLKLDRLHWVFPY